MAGKVWAHDLSKGEEEECDTCDALGAFKKKVSSAAKETVSIPTENDLNYWGMDRPPNVAELGRSSWTLLHTMAAYYPQEPTTEKKTQTRTFLDVLSKLYPCSYCAKDFESWMKENPPQLDNQKNFSHWMCRVILFFCQAASS